MIISELPEPLELEYLCDVKHLCNILTLRALISEKTLDTNRAKYNTLSMYYAKGFEGPLKLQMDRKMEVFAV